MKKPTLQSGEKSAAKLLQYADNILLKMTENADLFPEPEPTLAELDTAIGGFRDALSEASYRDMRKVEVKNQLQAVLRQVIYGLSLYVDRVAQGNAATILAAGFLPSKDTTRPGIAPKPTDFRVALPRINSQTAELRVKAWAPARVYQFEYRKVAGDDNWERVLSSKSTCVLEGLEKLQEYEFRVAYIGTDPTVTYSDAIRSYIL